MVKVLVFLRKSEEFVFAEKVSHSPEALRAPKRMVRSLFTAVIWISTTCGMGVVEDWVQVVKAPAFVTR